MKNLKLKPFGFTLIELLAIIIVLAIIALIATPIVLDVIEDSRSSANRSSVYMIINGATTYYAESMLDESKKLRMNGTTNIYDLIVVSGEKPEDGYLFVNQKGQVSISVIYGDTCYKKDFTDTVLTETKVLEACAYTGDIVTAKEVMYDSEYTECNDVDCALNELYDRYK